MKTTELILASAKYMFRYSTTDKMYRPTEDVFAMISLSLGKALWQEGKLSTVEWCVIQVHFKFQDPSAPLSHSAMTPAIYKMMNYPLAEPSMSDLPSLSCASNVMCQHLMCWHCHVSALSKPAGVRLLILISHTSAILCTLHEHMLALTHVCAGARTHKRWCWRTQGSCQWPAEIVCSFSSLGRPGTDLLCQTLLVTGDMGQTS